MLGERSTLPLHVLIVEDNHHVGTALSRSLQIMGYVARWTETGHEALALMKSGAKFDVMLTDIAMPGMDGLQLATAALEADPALRGRIVAMTGGAPRHVIAGFAALDIEVVSKPFGQELLQDLFVDIRPRGES